MKSSTRANSGAPNLHATHRPVPASKKQHHHGGGHGNHHAKTSTRTTRDRDRDRDRDRGSSSASGSSPANKSKDRSKSKTTGTATAPAATIPVPPVHLKDLTLDDVKQDFATWSDADLARYRKATKLPQHPPPRPVAPPASPGIHHLHLSLPASARSLLQQDHHDLDLDSDLEDALPPPTLVSVLGMDAARAKRPNSHHSELCEFATRHYHTAAKIPLLDAPPPVSNASDTPQPSVMVHPRAEAETILYFLYASRFNRHRHLQLPAPDAALMIREVREGKFATVTLAPSSSSLAGATTSAGALRARQAAAGLSGAGPFSVGPAGPGQVGGTLGLRGAGSESERQQQHHHAAAGASSSSAAHMAGAHTSRSHASSSFSSSQGHRHTQQQHPHAHGGPSQGHPHAHHPNSAARYASQHGQYAHGQSLHHQQHHGGHPAVRGQQGRA